jgi:hypothetical protein
MKLLGAVKKVHIAKGKKVESFALGKGADLDAIVEGMLGRTGNLRAPTIKVGKSLYVGFPKDGFDDLSC